MRYIPCHPHLNWAFCLMVVKPGIFHASCICLSIMFTSKTSLVLMVLMDSIGLYWIGRDSIKRLQWSPSDNISTLPDVHLTSATLLRRNFWKYYFHWKVLGIEFWLFYWKTTFSFRIYRYVCQLILNVHVDSEMHIVQHQKWGHAGRPHNVSLWIVFKIIQVTKWSQPTNLFW